MLLLYAGVQQKPSIRSDQYKTQPASYNIDPSANSWGDIFGIKRLSDAEWKEHEEQRRTKFDKRYTCPCSSHQRLLLHVLVLICTAFTGSHDHCSESLFKQLLATVLPMFAHWCLLMSHMYQPAGLQGLDLVLMSAWCSNEVAQNKIQHELCCDGQPNNCCLRILLWCCCLHTQEIVNHNTGRCE